MERCKPGDRGGLRKAGGLSLSSFATWLSCLAIWAKRTDVTSVVTAETG